MRLEKGYPMAANRQETRSRPGLRAAPDVAANLAAVGDATAETAVSNGGKKLSRPPTPRETSSLRGSVIRPAT